MHQSAQAVYLSRHIDGQIAPVDGLQKPGAVRFDAQERLFVLDDATGELFALDRKGDAWSKRLVIQLATSTDNMMPGPDGLIYVSNMADSTVHAVSPETGTARIVVAGGLGFPRAIAVQYGAGGDRLHAADGCAYRIINVSSGMVHDVARAVAAKLKFPTSVSVNARHVLLTSEAFGIIQVFDHDGRLVRDVEGFLQQERHQAQSFEENVAELEALFPGD